MAIEESQLPDLTAPQRAHWYPERDDITLFGVLNALADPLRLEIVRNLDKHEERCPYDFLTMTSKQNLVHHFKVLREAGLIMSRYEGRNKFTRLRRELIDEMFPGVIDAVLSAAPKS
jgi:DNA-binding transcriptional ArsR family regulator